MKPEAPRPNVHLIKLCVGVESVDQLYQWQTMRLEQKRKSRQKAELWHTTRMMPKRREELLDGGSLYWVIKGVIRVRQRLVDIRPFVDEDKINRCRLVYEPLLVATRPQPRRPFQGWRYLKAEDTPSDMGPVQGVSEEGSAELRQELVELGLL